MPTEPTETEVASPEEVMSAQSDRYDNFFANEDNESDTPIEPDPVDDGTDGMDDPYLDDDPDYDPDELDDPDNPKEEPEEVVEEEEEGDEPTPEKEPETPEEEPETPVEEVDDTSQADFDEFKASVLAEIEANAADPQAGKKWAELRFENKQAKLDMAKMQAEGVNTPEMQEIKARSERLSDMETKLQETESKLAMFDFQSSPEYQAEIQAPYQAIQNNAKGIETSASIPEGEIIKAISVSDRATQDANIQNLIDSYDIPRRDENNIFNMANDMLNLTAKDAELRETASERLSESREQATAREAYIAEEERASYRNELKNTFKQYEGKVGAFIDAEGNNNAEWTQAMKDSEDLDFKGDPEIQALGAYALTTVPHLMKQNEGYAAEIAKLKTIVNRQKSVKPPSVGEVTGAKLKPNARVKAKMSFSDAIEARLNAE